MIAVRHLSPEERARIEAAVTAAEKRTSAEFAVVVARQSDEYAFFPLLWAALSGAPRGPAGMRLAHGEAAIRGPCQ